MTAVIPDWQLGIAGWIFTSLAAGFFGITALFLKSIQNHFAVRFDELKNSHAALLSEVMMLRKRDHERANTLSEIKAKLEMLIDGSLAR